MLKPGSKAPTSAILVAAWACALTTFVSASMGFGTFDTAGAGLLVGAGFAFRRLQAEEVAERIDEARDVAQKRNVAAWKLIDLEVGKINAEITKVDDRDEIARLLDEEP